MSRSIPTRLHLPVGLASLVAGAILLLAIAIPAALAKEGVEVQLAAPLPADAEPGDTVTAFFVMTSISDAGDKPLRGSPVFIRLYGPRGAMTQAAGVENRVPGTYRAEIVIPEGGASRAEFGIHGSRVDASGKTVESDIVWPYDGILVAAAIEPPVDPGTFQLPGTKQLTQPAVNPAAQPGAWPATATGSNGSDAGPTLVIDLRLLGVAVLALGLIGLAAAGRRRRVHRSPA